MKNFYKIFGSFKFSFVPPLMIYLAAGVSGITNIVGLFFVKEYLDLSAVFLAGLGFWTLWNYNVCYQWSRYSFVGHCSQK